MTSEESYALECLIINANHLAEKRLKAHIVLLKILLREAKGEWVSTIDRFKIQDIAKAYPDFADYYKIKINRNL